MGNQAEEDIRKLVEKASKELLERKEAGKLRGHLGASQIGHRCARQAWYSFRWAYRGQHLGRMMRLFNRGHEEESRLMRWLRAAGYEIQDHSERLWYHDGLDSYVCRPWDWGGDPQDQFDMTLDDVSEDPVHIRRATERNQGPKQWQFVDDTTGHFSGSSDGKIRGPHLPEGWGGLEFKTGNDKSFKDITAKGVLSSKPVYWVQMQIYMKAFGLSWTLFVMVNKNDDEIYYEIVYAKPEIGEQYYDLATRIIKQPVPPPRLTEDPSWFECKFCDFREICHHGVDPQKNCRTCAYVEIKHSVFHCTLHHGDIPIEFQNVGCDQWVPFR